MLNFDFQSGTKIIFGRGVVNRLGVEASDYDARASIMWAGALSWNGITNAGLEGARIPNHMFEHPLSGLYNIAHGAGLAVVMPAWLGFKKDEIGDRIIRFGEKILGLHSVTDAGEVIESFRSWLKSIGCPSTLSELGIEKPDIKELTKHVRSLAGLWNIDGYSDADIAEVYRLCM